MPIITPFLWFSEAFSFFVWCWTQAGIDNCWKKFSSGGQEQQCGWHKDRFDLSWPIVPEVFGELLGDPDPATSGRPVQAMLGTVKFDIAALPAAVAES